MEILKYMASHFLSLYLLWTRYGQIWNMLCRGREVWSQTDQILGIDLHLFHKISIRDPRHNSNNILILGWLLSAALRDHQLYLGTHIRLPIHPPRRTSREDALFDTILRVLHNPPARNHCRNYWISEEAGWCIEARLSLRSDPYINQHLIRKLVHRLWSLLDKYQRQRVLEADTSVGTLLASDPPLPW